MNRFDRITSILIQLQSKKVVTAQEIADRFEISLRTVYRDIRSLEEAGIPLIGEVGKGYSLVDGYKLPPVMFTREEALAFVTSSALIQKINDDKLRQNFDSALFKIKSVLKGPEKDLVEYLEKNVQLVSHKFSPPSKPIPLEIILSAIASKMMVEFTYFANSNQSESTRKVEPIGVFQTGNNWRLIAFCHLRQDYRDFRLDRITAASLRPETFTKEHPPFDQFIRKEEKELELTRVIFRTCKNSWGYFGDQKYYFGLVKEIEVGDQMEMHFFTSQLWGISRWAMSFMDSIEIDEPKEMIDLMLYMVEKFNKKQGSFKSAETSV